MSINKQDPYGHQDSRGRTLMSINKEDHYGHQQAGALWEFFSEKAEQIRERDGSENKCIAVSGLTVMDLVPVEHCNKTSVGHSSIQYSTYMFRKGANKKQYFHTKN